MAEKDSQGPSLELPSLFRRKRAQKPLDTAESTDRPEPPAEPTEEVRPAASADDQETAPLPAAQPETAPEPEPEPAADPASTSAPTGTTAPGQTRRPRPRLTLPSVGAPRDDRRETGSVASAESSSRGGPQTRSERPPERQPEPRREPEPATSRQETTREQEPVTPAAAATAPAATPPAARPTTPAAGTATQQRPADHGETAPDGQGRRSRPTLPALAAATAALVVGAAVGLLGVVLTFLGLQGCQLVAGTSSCGGPGLLVLVAIFVAMVLAGAAALKLFGVPEAGSVSFLGTGLLMVILLTFFLEALDHASMVLVIPALAAPCFALARWVTTQLSEDVMEDR